jgi:hypothetical protein
MELGRKKQIQIVKEEVEGQKIINTFTEESRRKNKKDSLPTFISCATQ